jgi:hypothetical protein
MTHIASDRNKIFTNEKIKYGSNLKAQAQPMTPIVIDPRYNGLPDIALGGYIGGVLARGHIRAEAVLRRPVHLGRPYQTAVGPDGTRALQDGNEVLAVSRDSPVDLEVPRSVGLEASKHASEHYLRHRRHLIPTCFNCGPSRPEGDGLRIFPGAVVGCNFVAAPWTPSTSLANSSGAVEPEFIWSALDCPTIWALILLGRHDTDERAVTARLAVELLSPVVAGQPQVVMAWKVAETERTRVGGGAIYSANGRLLATARHTIVTTDWGVPMGLDCWR